MTVFVLMPVHNRIKATESMVSMLRAQKLDEQISIIVIDDGSQDGTSEWLKNQKDVTVINGNGSLWWGGAIQKGYQYCDRNGQDGDWIAFVNDDTFIKENFLAELLNVAKNNTRAIVGSLLRGVSPPHNILSVAPIIDARNLTISDWQIDANFNNLLDGNDFLHVDALSGRGVLYPIEALRDVRGLRPRLLPHYMADYELSLRVKKMHWVLLIATKTAVYTEDIYGNQVRQSSWLRKYSSVRSPSYLPSLIGFWWAATKIQDRFSLPYRAIRSAFAAKKWHS